MAEAPGLSEIINIARDPGEGAISPRTVINTTDLVHNLNNAAQFKAENDWRKYANFQKDLKDTFKQLGDIEGLEVADADREYLHKQAAEVFDEIGKDPQGFFGGKMADVEKKIGKLRSQSQQSMQDKVFDDAHRAYIERDPSLQTEDNKRIVGDYFKQPLGQRKPYMLKLPSLYNPQEIGAQINAVIPQKFSQTGLSPDGKFINTQTGIRYDEKQYKLIADQMFSAPDPKTGVPIAVEVQGRFKELPKPLQDAYIKKYPDDPIKGFYDETVMPWKKPDQIEKTESKADPFAVQAMKNQAKLEEMNVKFGYDKVLQGMKSNTSFALAKFKEKLHQETKMGKVGALKGMVDTMVKDAQTGPPVVTPEGTFYKLNVSSDVLKSYGTKEGVLKKEVKPDDMLVSEDGSKIKQIYYKQAGKPASGVDENKSRTFSKEEFTARFGKDVLGVSATEKEINADDEGVDEGGSSSTTTTTTKSSSKKSIPGF